MSPFCPQAGPSPAHVTKRYNALAPGATFGSGPERHWDGGLREMHAPAYESGYWPLRHWLRREPTWQVLAAAGLTHPRHLVAAARRAGLEPHWRGRVRAWSWPELLQLAAAAATEAGQ